MNEKLEQRFNQLAEERISSKKFKIFDINSRVVKRHKFPDLKKTGKTDEESCLVILNAEGEAIVLTEEFEKELYRIAKIRFGK